MDDSEKELVRARTDIVALISQYTPLRRTGSKYKGLCPFHQEKTPSFHVDPELGRWRCYGACSEGGDAFKFLEKAEGLSFREALEVLAERAGITLTRGAGGPAEQAEAQRQRAERDSLFAVNSLAVRFFRESFGRARLAREYAAKRGLTHQTMEAFGIGYTPDDWSALAEFLRAQRIHLEDAEKAGLIFPSRRGDGTYTDKFRGRLMFPIIDTQERIVGFGGRLLVPAENAPKYLNSPETPVFSKSKILYALNRARKAIEKADQVLVVEGYMDAVACHQAGIENVVATLGTSLTDEHVRLIRRYTRNVVLSFDADDAGVRAALRAAELFRATASVGTAAETGSLRVLSLPAGEDPDSLLTKGDVAAFRKAIDAALTVPEFRLKSIHARFDTQTEAGKVAFLREALPVVADVPSVLDQDLLIRRLAAFHPSGGSRAEESLRSEVTRLQRLGGRGGIPDAPPPGDEDADAAPRAPLRGEIVIPPRRYGGGGSGGRTGGAYGSGGGGFSQRPPYGQPRRGYYSAPPMPEAPPPPPRTAAENAERTLLRALLDEEWSATVAQRAAAGGLFSDERTVRLAEALTPLLAGHISPAKAIAQLTDPELADLAADVLMDDADSAPLTEEVIADCLRVLKLRQIRAANERDVREQREGNRPLTDEELRQWSRRSRAAKNSGGQEEQT